MKVTATYSLSLPSGVKVDVKKGRTIQSGDVIASGEKKAVVQEYNLASLLNVSPRKVLGCLTKKLGEKVSLNELIAQKKALLEKRTKKFFSPQAGVLSSLTQEGKLRLEKAGVKIEIKAPFAAKVTAVSEKGFSLSFPAWELKGCWGRGGQEIGRLVVLKEKEIVDIFDLVAETKGQIVAFWGSFTSGFWYKAISLGLKGLVAGQLNDKDLQSEVKKEDLPLVVMSEKKIDEQIWQRLQKNQGKTVLIEGETQRLLIPR